MDCFFCICLLSRMHKEIQKVTKGASVTTEDMCVSHYSQAVIMETLRLCDVMPLGMPHGLSENVLFKKYKLPRVSCLKGMFLKILLLCFGLMPMTVHT